MGIARPAHPFPHGKFERIPVVAHAFFERRVLAKARSHTDTAIRHHTAEAPTPFELDELDATERAHRRPTMLGCVEREFAPELRHGRREARGCQVARLELLEGPVRQLGNLGDRAEGSHWQHYIGTGAPSNPSIID